jgi:hypothetical protein
MNNKTKKMIAISFIAAIFLSVIPLLILNSKPDPMEYKSGNYYCKINIIGSGTRNFKWDIGLSKNSKISINETDRNRENLEYFRKAVRDISSRKITLYMIIIYMLFVLFVFTIVHRDNLILKNEKDKKIFKSVIAVTIIFLSFKIIISLVELNWLYDDINYYYSLILS